MKSSSYFRWCFLAGALAVMAATIWGMYRARNWALAELSSPESIQAWQEWKIDVEKQQERPGPVKRRPIKANEPPHLILLRDYFGAALIASLVVAVFIYGFAVLVLGGLRGKQP